MATLTHAEIKKPSRREVLDLLREKKYLLYLGGYFFRMMGVTGVFFWGAVYLHRHFGVNNQEATSFIGSAYLFAGVPGIFFAGFLAGRLARRVRGAYAFWLVGSELLSAVCVSIVLLCIHDLTTAKLLLLGQMFFAGNSWSMINPLLFDFAPQLSPKNIAAIDIQKKFLRDYGYVKKDFAVSEWADASYLEEAIRSLGKDD